jgi:hypothetical protein
LRTYSRRRGGEHSQLLAVDLHVQDANGTRKSLAAGAIEQRCLCVCLAFLLEAGYSARSAADELVRKLMALPMVHIDTVSSGALSRRNVSLPARDTTGFPRR